jgi:hypothetical protein
MPDLIDSVVDLTARRNRDELEFIVASVLFEQISLSKLILWRILSHSGSLKLHRRTQLTHGRVAVSDIFADASELQALDSRPELRACYDSRASLRIDRSRKGMPGADFPDHQRARGRRIP